MAKSKQKSLRSEAHAALIAMIKEQRRAAGLTQEDVAAALGWPQPHVSKAETGDRRIDVVEFIQICQIIGLDACDGIAKICELADE